MTTVKKKHGQNNTRRDLQLYANTELDSIFLNLSAFDAWRGRVHLSLTFVCDARQIEVFIENGRFGVSEKDRIQANFALALIIYRVGMATADNMPLKLPMFESVQY